MNKLWLLAFLAAFSAPAGEPARYAVRRVLVQPADMAQHRPFWGTFRRIFLGETPKSSAWGRPMSVAARGTILAVADSGAGVVWLIGSGKKFSKAGPIRPPEGPFAPIDLALSDTTLYASDSEAGRVWAMELATQRWEALRPEFVRPTGLFYSADRATLLIVDTGAHALYGWDGTDLQTICDSGLNFPTDVAEDASRRLFVADMMDHEVEIRSWTGERLSAFGASGDAPGYFSFIRGIAMDAAGHVYVSDVRKNWVQVFSPEGELLSVLGEGLGLNHPSYLNFEGDSLWIADTYTRRVIEVGVR